MPAGRVIDRDLGYRRIVSGFKTVGDTVAKVGFLDDGKRHGRGTASVATIAAGNEFGTATAPARPAFRRAIDEKGDEIAEKAGRYFAQHAGEPGAERKALELAGQAGQAAVRASYVNARDFVAPLAPATIAARRRRSVGSTAPLVDTGQTVGSVTYAVVHKGAA